MARQLTVIGLGQIGASVGMALAPHRERLRCVGYDHNPQNLRRAKKIGSVGKTVSRLSAALSDADYVLLALPVSEVQEILDSIARYLKEGVVVLDASPVRAAARAWAQQALPEGAHYIGFTPLLGPRYLHAPQGGLEGARADLFRAGVFAVSASPHTSSEALQFASDLAEMLGAEALFSEEAEVDGFMAATHLLPQLLAAALSNVTVDKPGWEEGRKFAGQAFAQSTSAIGGLDRPAALAAASIANRENLTRILNGLIRELRELRAEIAQEQHEPLGARLERARRGRQRWWEERAAADWRPDQELPSAGHKREGILSRWLSLSWLARAEQDYTERKKES